MLILISFALTDKSRDDARSNNPNTQKLKRRTGKKINKVMMEVHALLRRKKDEHNKDVYAGAHVTCSKLKMNCTNPSYRSRSLSSGLEIHFFPPSILVVVFLVEPNFLGWRHSVIYMQGLRRGRDSISKTTSNVIERLLIEDPMKTKTCF